MGDRVTINIETAHCLNSHLNIGHNWKIAEITFIGVIKLIEAIAYISTLK